MGLLMVQNIRSINPDLNVLDSYSKFITILVGENGSGKTKALVNFSKQARMRNQRILSLSNTFYDRFSPASRSQNPIHWNFHHKAPVRSLHEALIKPVEQRERNLERIFKVLDYMGFEENLGISLNPQILHFQRRRASQSFYLEQLWGKLEEEFKRHPNEIIWLHKIAGYKMSSLNILELMKELSEERISFPLIMDFHLIKDGRLIPFKTASSGESTLLTSYAFFVANIQPGALVLIDEPENSLHPRWQHEYCSKLLDMLSLYSPQIIIATHSPVVVSGAQSHGLPIKIFEVDDDQLYPRHVASSIEETLYESFGTLSPSNHFLSEMVARLLDELSQGKLSEREFQQRLTEFENSSYDPTQQEFLKKVRAMGRKVLIENFGRNI